MQFKNVAVVSTAGVIAALAIGAGGAYAASQIDSAGIQDDSVRGIDVKDGTVRLTDINNSTEKALKGATGGRGPQGPAGEQGPVGPEGPSGFNTSYMRSETFWVLAGTGTEGGGTAWCEEGDLAVGGGYDFLPHTAGFSKIIQNRMEWHSFNPDDRPDGWHVQAIGGDWDAHGKVYVNCISTN